MTPPPTSDARPSRGPLCPVGSRRRFQAIAIGASTGGPEALSRILPVLTAGTPLPIFIVQHFPAGMTGFFASSLARTCSHRVIEAVEGGIVEERTVYIAPGGRHLLLRRHEGRVFTALNDQPPENFCRPSVDVLFRSAAAAYDGSVIAIVLTGMGCDGAHGLGALKRSGAQIIAQDEATCVVWGMPRAAVDTRQVDAVLPLPQIPAAVLALLGSR